MFRRIWQLEGMELDDVRQQSYLESHQREAE